MFSAICGAVLGAVFVSAGAVKMRYRSHFIAAVYSWGLTTPRMTRFVARLIPAGELGLGTGLIWSAWSKTGAWAALAVTAAVLILFILAQGVIVVRDKARIADCGCFGRASRVNALAMSRTGALLGVTLAAMVAR
ncbi:MAG: hypothetical protein HYX53_04170 [Chloroflexi bacterium]|nr:hypothetical protein [Chloroflexota bacterium]